MAADTPTSDNSMGNTEFAGPRPETPVQRMSMASDASVLHATNILPTLGGLKTYGGATPKCPERTEKPIK